MVPKFIPVQDLNNNRVYPGGSIKGVQQYHTDWNSLFSDDGVGDSLANTVRHWNETCEVDVPFLIIGGSQSIAAVLQHDRTRRLVCPYDPQAGVVAFITREKRTFGKDYTSILVIPATFFRHPMSVRIENLGSLGLQASSSSSSPRTSSENLKTFRLKWGTFSAIHKRYIDV